jgi:hypothetical protein
VLWRASASYGNSSGSGAKSASASRVGDRLVLASVENDKGRPEYERQTQELCEILHTGIMTAGRDVEFESGRCRLVKSERKLEMI